MSASPGKGKPFSLKAPPGLRTILYFYPRDNTPGCTTEAIDFTAKLAVFKKLGVRVIGVSRDTEASHERFRAKHAIGIELVSDPDGKLCDQFAVLKMKSLYGRKFIGIERSTFLLDNGGKILKEWRKVKVAGHVEEVVTFLKESKQPALKESKQPALKATKK